jgi:ribosome-associated heat shock protein Hsp15
MPPPTTRLDLWLVHARFCKSRSIAAALIGTGHLRLNGQPCAKPAHPVTPGDRLTFPLGARIRLIRISALGQRRGPPSEAQLLYTDLESPAPLR